MKTQKITFLILGTFLLIQSCSDKKTKPFRVTYSYELDGRDTINYTDGNGFKQGHWIVKKYIAVSKTIQTTYAGEKGVHSITSNDIDRLKVEEGNYFDNKKEGLWRSFYPSGQVKDSAIYKTE